MKRYLLILWICLFVVMTGYGMTLATLPFFIERMASRGAITNTALVAHIGMLTGIFALMQLFFAPVWGKWSDCIGRRPVILLGLGGFSVGSMLFGLSSGLIGLYTSRIIAGMMAAAILPIAAAYVSDLTNQDERAGGGIAEEGEGHSCF